MGWLVALGRTMDLAMIFEWFTTESIEVALHTSRRVLFSAAFVG